MPVDIDTFIDKALDVAPWVIGGWLAYRFFSGAWMENELKKNEFLKEKKKK